jgi:hypothetical protein
LPTEDKELLGQRLAESITRIPTVLFHAFARVFGW